MCRYLQQFDQLVFIKGDLHRVHEENGPKYHQTELPIEYRAQRIGMLHDVNSHQGVKCTLALVWEDFVGALCCMIFKVGSKLSVL